MRTLIRISAKTAATLHQTAAFFQHNATATTLTYLDVQDALQELNTAYAAAQRRQEARPTRRPLRVRVKAAVRELLTGVAIAVFIVLVSLEW